MTNVTPSPNKARKSRRSSSSRPDEKAPLLPKTHDLEGFNGASLGGAVFNLSNGIVGAGLMSLPAVMKVLGLGVGFPLLILMGFLSATSAEMLLRFTKAAKCDSYAGVMGKAFGGCGRILLQLSIIVATAGILIVYMIIIGDVLSGTTSAGVHHAGLLEWWFGEHWWNTRSSVILVTTLAVFSPLACFQRIDSLRFTSAVSITLAFVFLVVMVGIVIFKLMSGSIVFPRFLPDLTDLSSFWKLFTVAPVLATAFSGHLYVHSIVNELEDSSQEKAVVRSSIGLCSIIYLTASTFGFLLFGEATLDDVLANFDDASLGIPYSSLINSVVRITYIGHLMFVFPIAFYTLRLSIDGLLFPLARPLHQANIRFSLLTMSLLAMIVAGATLIPNIWDAFQFTGATAGICTIFIFPSAITLRDTPNIATKKDKILSIVMIVVALLATVVAMYSNISGLFERNLFRCEQLNSIGAGVIFPLKTPGGS